MTEVYGLIDNKFNYLSLLLIFSFFFKLFTPQRTLARNISSHRGAYSFLFKHGSREVAPGTFFSNYLMNKLSYLAVTDGSGYLRKSGFVSDVLRRLTLMALILVVRVCASLRKTTTILFREFASTGQFLRSSLFSNINYWTWGKLSWIKASRL